MAIIKGYADDSQTTGKIWVVSGYAGSELHWEAFEHQWPIVLAKHDVPYFHYREFADPNGVYKKWYPPQDHRDELVAFFSDLTQVVSDCYLTAFSSVVRIGDLNRFNSETGAGLEPYPLAAYGCQLLLCRYYEGIPVEVIFDHVEQIKSKLAKADEYADSDTWYGSDLNTVISVPLPSAYSFRSITPLQAADFLAWEHRKSHLSVTEFFELKDRPDDFEQGWIEFESWSQDKFGSTKPPSRKSADALLDGNPLEVLIWDYTNLMQMHRVRNGTWGPAKR